MNDKGCISFIGVQTIVVFILVFILASLSFDMAFVRSEDVGEPFTMEIIGITISQDRHGYADGYILSYSEDGEVRTVHADEVSIGNGSYAVLKHQIKDHTFPFVATEHTVVVISATVTEELYSGIPISVEDGP